MSFTRSDGNTWIFIGNVKLSEQHTISVIKNVCTAYCVFGVLWQLSTRLGPSSKMYVKIVCACVGGMVGS